MKAVCLVAKDEAFNEARRAEEVRRIAGAMVGYLMWRVCRCLGEKKGGGEKCLGVDEDSQAVKKSAARPPRAR